MTSNPLTHRAYRERRAIILANAVVCGICGSAECPHCAGKAKHCKGRLSHIDHGRPRSKGGPVDASNEQAAHACCNLKKGDRDGSAEPLQTSREW